MKERQGGRAVGAAFPPCPVLCGYSSVVISFTSVGRHFPTNITDAVLGASLKALMKNGMINRQSYDEIPPRVEYSLMEKGLSAVPIL